MRRSLKTSKKPIVSICHWTVTKITKKQPCHANLHGSGFLSLIQQNTEALNFNNITEVFCWIGFSEKYVARSSFEEEPGTCACLLITDRVSSRVQINHRKWQGCTVRTKGRFCPQIFGSSDTWKKIGQSRCHLQSWKLEQALFENRPGVIRAHQKTTEYRHRF